MSTGNKIKELRIKKGLTQEELGKLVGVQKAAIYKYETGLVINIKRSIIAKLAEALNTTPTYLLDMDEKLKNKGLRIPILGKVAAGVPIEAIEDIIDYEDISQCMAYSGSYFGLKIQGDSMWPEIMDGDIAIIRQQPDCESGDTAVVIVNGQDATVKRIKKRPEGIMLIPNNHNYEPMLFNNDDIKNMPLTICGKVVEIRRKL